MALIERLLRRKDPSPRLAALISSYPRPGRDRTAALARSGQPPAARNEMRAVRGREPSCALPK